MDFRIADTFTDSLAKLTGDGQKAVKTTAFDLQMNPVNLGMSFHKLDKAKDTNFWSVRVSSGIRVIVHKTASSLLLCYVDHHDKAYHWAERRKLETHPKTGAAQLLEIRERVEEITVPKYIEVAQPAIAIEGIGKAVDKNRIVILKTPDVSAPAPVPGFASRWRTTGGYNLPSRRPIPAPRRRRIFPTNNC